MIYVGLLRGINVGGNNRVQMVRLKSLFEKLGLANVKTYINSGNIIFDDEHNTSKATLHNTIEAALEKEFGFAIKLVLVGADTLKTIEQAVPKDWVNGGDMKCDIMFLADNIDMPDTKEALQPNPDIEDLRYVKGALLWRIDRKNVGKSKVLRMIGTPIYKNMTLRNVNTLRKLTAML